MKRAWNLGPVPQIVQKILKKYCPCLYLPIDQVWQVRVVVQKIESKMLPISCANNHHDVTDLANRGWFKIQKLEYLKNGT